MTETETNYTAVMGDARTEIDNQLVDVLEIVGYAVTDKAGFRNMTAHQSRKVWDWAGALFFHASDNTVPKCRLRQPAFSTAFIGEDPEPVPTEPKSGPATHYKSFCNLETLTDEYVAELRTDAINVAHKIGNFGAAPLLKHMLRCLCRNIQEAREERNAAKALVKAQYEKLRAIEAEKEADRAKGGS